MSTRVTLEVIQRISEASNATFFCRDPHTGIEYVYKPVQGERPLWDFPHSSLTGREIAASELNQLTGWGLVPPTQWIQDAPFGEGMAQQWVPQIESDRPVDLFTPESVPEEWIVVLSGYDHVGNPVVLAHADTSDLRKLSVFDSMLNNADRKAGHILANNSHQIFAIDHGVCFHEESKLRTVIWGWAGSSIPLDLLSTLENCLEQLGARYDPIDMWLSDGESSALRRRIEHLIEFQTYPLPSPEWPAIPWPVF